MLDDYQPKPRALWIAALIFLIAAVADSWFRWATFQYDTFDLAFYHQAFWLAGQGQWHVPMLDVPLMGNHAEPICFLLMPIFWIWSHPMMFVVVQALLLITMPFTGYRIARRLEFERNGALWMGLATLLAPVTGFVAIHEFHPETLAAPFILLMIEARLASRPGSFWLFFLLAVMCKENVALLMGWFCAVHWVLEREKGKEWQIVFNLLPGAVAIGWVVAYAVWLGPKWNGGKVDYVELYAHLGGSGGEILKNIVTDPLRIGGAIWKALWVGNLVWGLLLPFLLLPLLRPRWLMISIPIFAQHLLSSRSSEWFIHVHYGAPLLPLLWIGMAEAAANLYWRDVVARWAAVACLVGQVWIGPARKMWGTITSGGEAMEQAVQRREMLSLIPPDASVMAGYPYLSHLTRRAQLHSLHFTLKGLKTLSRAAYTPPKVDVVMVDVSDSFTYDAGAGLYHPTMKTVDGQIIPDSDVLLNRVLLGGSWKVMPKNSISVFLRGEATPPEPVTGEGRKLDEFHTLVGIQSLPPQSPGTATIMFTWELKKDRPMLPWAGAVLRNAAGQEWAVQKGPVALGMEDGRFRELWILAPNLPPGKYQCQLLLYDNQEQARQSPQPFQPRRFEVGEISL